jgi:hypothetical protein
MILRRPCGPSAKQAASISVMILHPFIRVVTLGLALSVVSGWSLGIAAELTGTVVSVLDGDTIEVLHNRHAERILLSGIDCSEKWINTTISQLNALRPRSLPSYNTPPTRPPCPSSFVPPVAVPRNTLLGRTRGYSSTPPTTRNEGSDYRKSEAGNLNGHKKGRGACRTHDW